MEAGVLPHRLHGAEVSDAVRCTIGFLGGCVIGVMTVMFVWSVTDPVYAPYYLEES